MNAGAEIDLTALAADEFEGLCYQLLIAEGFAFRDTDRRNAPFDFVGIDSAQKKVVVECKRLRHSTGIGLREAVQNLARAKEFVFADIGYLIVAQRIATVRRTELLHDAPWLVLLDADDVSAMLQRSPAIAARYVSLAFARRAVVEPAILAGQDQPSSGATLLIELGGLPRGRDHFRAYEDFVMQVLNYVFCPPLGTLTVQSRSEDGLDVRDAIYPIFAGKGFWDWLRLSCSAWFVVVECKNLTESPGQKEVESLQQYLYREAMRSFGLLVSRGLPSEQAMKARRRSWQEFKKLIVFIDDALLGDLIRAKDTGERPERLLELQLMDFFAKLSP